MKLKCKNCLPKKGIKKHNFTITQKIKLIELKTKSGINATKYLREDLKYDAHTAKYLAVHMNVESGKCQNCNFTDLNKEYMNCPKCNRLNLNFDI